MSASLGLNAKAYYATSRATWGTLDADGYSHSAAAPGGLTELTNIRDLSLNMTNAEADVTTRGSGGFELTLATLTSAEINFDMVYDTADTGFVKMQNAFFNKTNLPLAFLSGNKTSTNSAGLWIDAMVTKFEKSENLADAQMVSVSVKPGYSTVAPEWVKVA